jgi:hypothetical protein
MNTLPELKGHHIQHLEEESGIAREVIAERGVRSITHGRELPKGFAWRQRRRVPGILFSVHRPNGERDHIFRPDHADPATPGLKYEARCKAYGAPGNVLDVHPSMHHLINDASAPVVFVEGIKKSDALLTAARAVGLQALPVAISGVWNWLSDGEPISDMLDIPLEGRKVVIGFDSDMLRNPDVQEAAKRLAEYLLDRGAKVWVIYLSDKPDGSKMGLDDHFAGGGTIAELRLLMRPYNPEDFTVMRLSRDERLRLALEDLERMFWAFEWKGMGGHSARDVYLKLIEAARRHGKVVDDGIQVTKAQGPLAIEAKVSSRTLWKALNRLEEWSLLYRDNEGRKDDKPGAFVLHASVSHYGEGQGDPEAEALPEVELHKGDLHLRAPRLRWSYPGSRPRRGTVKGTRKVRQGTRQPPRDPIKRLGKIRGHIVDVLDAAGGEASLQEIAAAMHKARPRELVRAKTTKGGRNGPVIMLLQAGIVEWACDVATRREILRLTPNWLEALENARRLGKEIDVKVNGKLVEGADTLQARRYREKRDGFHNRTKIRASRHWTNTGADGAIEDLRPESEVEEASAGPPPLSPLAAAVRSYLERSPRDACQPPGWIGTTLWAYELYGSNPSPADVKAAIEELGGESYLRERLRLADRRAA